MLDRLKALRTRPWLVALLLGLAAQTLFTVHLDRPSRIMFDEVHYVPAAQALLDREGPRNIEHPLVGKELIGAGIVLFGDNPFGWRAFTTLAGTATVLGAFAFLWLLLGSMRAALVAAILTTLNQSVYVQARTAMLDIFLGAFLLWAMVLMLWAMKGPPPQVKRRWIGAAVLLGLAVGTKWAAIPYVALAGFAFIVIRLRDARRAKNPLASALSGKDQPHWPGLGLLPGLLILGGVSIATYFATFFPAFFYERDPLTFARLIPLQQEMYALQTQVLARHTYQSDWWSWPLMLRPIWYFYEWDAGAQRGVLLIGNPLIMWGGLVAVLACLWAWLREHAIRPGAIALLWIASLGIYVVIPKSLGFYYYYHLSAIFLCLALAAAFHHFDRGRDKGREEWFVAASLLAFLYFYPILAASALSDAQGFRKWMWFPGWL
ncbi:dolichyl-phosphate-mannose--protein O-mannosyl transferase [Sphingomonas naasensis]|uniref:Polyprenol-phosphate-mannose--protein mannosyltransferase n=1 Tax=Sphingomonas naasensis TaxID=1344951 RepID=A0A4S1W7Y7_9SPHN|nr:phospholipid carrier-dependent glycosyltransferase [Sphingomonas naasensis]NIJ19635.1 dolichyl-phosphate-mannose--protein O-mannosyl transferase [Sphingomonas naasensis]TGX37290.1 phospholipid carrier-dependent glycosyltransferase [Sphingomonas naasensis]